MLKLRPMHDAEAPLVKDTWTRSLDASEYSDEKGRKKVISGRMRPVSGNHCPYMRVGYEDYMASWAFHSMHRMWVNAIWNGLDIVVAAHPANDEAVGWCAFTPPGELPLVVHYVYVLGPPLDRSIHTARKQGTARRLLEHAALHADNREPRYSHLQGTTDSFGRLDSHLSEIVYAAWRDRKNRDAPMRVEVPVH